MRYAQKSRPVHSRFRNRRVYLLRPRLEAQARRPSSNDWRQGASGGRSMAPRPWPVRATGAAAENVSLTLIHRRADHCRRDCLQVVRMIWLLVAFLICMALSALIYGAARRVAAQTGLPEGKLIYSDTGFVTGKLGPATTDEYGRKVERPLVSERFGLIGRPDYLVETGDGIIPVEVKSARMPASGQPYDSHVLQLAAYCLLVEDLLDPEVNGGI